MQQYILGVQDHPSNPLEILGIGFKNLLKIAYYYMRYDLSNSDISGFLPLQEAGFFDR